MKFEVLFLLVAVLPIATVGLPNLGEFFSNLFKTTSGANKDSVKNTANERTKRQDPGIGDESQLPYEVRSSSLPMMPDRTTINSRYMPTLGNGYISTTVYGKDLFLNGLYSGEGSESHRAVIPALVMARVSLNNPAMEQQTIRKFNFNVKDGVFTETIDCPFAYIEHRTYVHQKYIRVLVTDIFARRKYGVSDGGVIYLNYAELNDTQDIRWGTLRNYENTNWRVEGTTVSSEAGVSTKKMHVFFHRRIRELSLRGSNDKLNETMIMSVDHSEAAAKQDFDSCLAILNQPPANIGHYQLFNEQKAAWGTVWSRGRVEVAGDNQLAKLTYFAQYYLYSNMPPIPSVASQPPQINEVFFGFTRNSMAKGGQGKDYQGHMFWDTEMYILPAILMLHPDMAKRIMRHRSAYSTQAREHAEASGKEGFYYPWESAFSGKDVTPDACIDCREKQIFTSAAVNWGIRQYYSATRDRDYLTNPDYNGCDMTRETARMYANLAVYNVSKARYDINNVMGPDDWHPNVNNNAFTNAIASLSIHWARYFACICGRDEREEVPDDWIQKALYLHLPFDNVKRLHNQHEGFENDKNNTIKQADTILLSYPLNWNMSIDIMRNDLEFYEILISPTTPAMTWSFMTIGWKWVNEEAKMLSYFLKSYQDYVIQPFKIWTEFNEQSQADQMTGSVNFLPGAGGFMQSLIYGFAGVRVRPEMLEFHNPIPPPGSHTLMLIGFNYMEANMTIEIKHEYVTINIHEIGDYPLILKRNDSSSVEEELPAGAIVTIDYPKQGFYIYSTIGTPCDHPRDYIYMPWGYSPWISAATNVYPIATVFMATLTALLLLWR